MPYSDKEKQKQYQREWVAQRRAAWFSDKVCAWCNTTEDLQLDHVDASTKISNRIWSWSVAKRDEELKKCQVLCAKCHDLKTQIAGDNHGTHAWKQHGTNSMYNKHKCRCRVCKDWNLAKYHRNKKRIPS